MPLAVFAITVATFWPVLDNGFVTWGDRVDLLNNPHYRGLRPANLAWMFATIQAGHYQPLSWISFAVDHAIWGMNPRGYHLTSLLLHAGCAVAVLFLIAELVGLAMPAPGERAALAWGALAGTLLFAAHPLRVETVAWATERRGSLSGPLVVLSVLMYVRYAEKRSHGSSEGPQPPMSWPSDRRYWIAVILFALSLLSKELGFTLPAVLLVLDVYPLRRLQGSALGGDLRRLVGEKVPFILLGTAGLVVSALDAASSGFTRSVSQYTIAQRAAQSFYGLGFYLRKTVVPSGLSPLYPVPPGLDPLAPRFVLSAVAVIVFTLALVRLRRRWPAALAAWVAAVIMLSPVLGVLQAGLQIAADRYTYLPAVGLSALVAGVLVRAWTSSRSAIARPLVGGLACIALAGLAAASWNQTRVWRDSETLWRHAAAVDPTNFVARNDLGSALVAANRLDDAAEQFEAAVAINPAMTDAQFNLGVIRANQGRLDEAIAHLRVTVALNPQDRQAQAILQQVLAARPER